MSLSLSRRAALFTLAVLAAPARGQGKPLATRELDVDGIVADVIESNRKDGVLTVRVRFRNVGTQPQKLSLVGVQGYIDTYIVDGNTKYQLLQDDRGQQAATARDGGGWLVPTIQPKGTFNWWGKFPAPQGSSYSLFLKVGPPIDGVPVVDQR